MANPKLKLDIDTVSIQSELDAVLNKFEKEFSDLSKLGSSLGLGDSFVSEIKAALNELKKFQTEYKNTLTAFSSGKVDVSTFDKFQKQVDTKIKGLSERITSVEKVISDFQLTLNGVDGSKVENRLVSMLKEFDEFKSKVEETTNLLNQFFDMVSSGKKATSSLDTSELEKIDNILKNIRKNEIGGKSGLKINLKDALNQLDIFEQKFYDLQDDLDDTKDPKTIISLQKELGETSAQLMQLINRIIELNKIDVDSLLDGSIGKIKIGDIFDFSEFVTEVDSVSAKTVQSLKNAKQQLEAEKKEVANNVQEITASSFEFTDGGIKIPVILNKTSIEQLQPSLDNVIESLSKYAKNNPVNVSMRLFTLKGNRNEQREINKELENIQANISQLPEGELKESLNGLYGNLESQFRRALKLEVEVELSDKAKDISKIVNDIKNTVGQEKISIYPEIIISPEEEEKLKNRLKEIQDGFSFNLTSEITSMSNSLKELLEKDNSEDWSKSFITGLNNIESKLKEIQPLVTFLTGSSNKKSNSSNQDISLIDQLSNAIKELNNVIQQQKDMSIDINMDSVLKKMNTLQSTIVLVHSGLGNLQAVLSNVNNTGGLQVILSTLDKIEKTISELNTKEVKIDTNIDIDEVVPDIQNEIIKSGKKVKIPITVLTSSVDDFINEIQFIIDSKLTNGDIGNESFVPNENNDLAGKQVTSLNKRVNNLKDKIDSACDVWSKFATNAENGTKIATDGVNNVIEKFDKLNKKITEASQIFKNIDFSSQLNKLNQVGNLIKNIPNNTKKDSSGENNQNDRTKQLQREIDLTNERLKLEKELLVYLSKGVSEADTRITDRQTRIDAIEQEIVALGDLKKTDQEIADFEEATRARQQSLRDAISAAEEKENKQKQKYAEDTVKAAEKQTKAQEQQLKQQERLERSQDTLARKVAEWLNNNSAAEKQFGAELRDMYSRLSSSADMTDEELARIRKRFEEIKAQAASAGQTGSSMFNMIKQRAKSMIATLTTFNSFYDVVRIVKQGFNSVRELDTALVDLRKTTTMSNSELNQFYFDSNDVAKQLGVTTAEVITQASAWSRLGYSSKEASTEMAKLSSQFAAISPGMDIEQSTDGLVSTMKAFDIEYDNVLDGIMSKINIIGNTAATSNSEIVDMLTRSSAAMAEANNTLEETIALETAAVEITRNAETTGTTFKTLAMRIRGYDEDGEVLEDYEELKGKIADLTKTSKTPGGISLFTDASKTEFKSTYQLLKDIHEIYSDLTDKQQAGLLEALAGKRGGQVIASVLNNWDAVSNAIDNMANSAGNADAEMEVIKQSWDYKINALKETWVGTIQSLLDREDIGKLIDGLTSVSEVIGSIVSNLGLVKTALMGIAAVWGGKKLGYKIVYTM